MKTISAKEFQMLVFAFVAYLLLGSGFVYLGVPGSWMGSFLGIWIWTVVLSKIGLIKGQLTFRNALFLYAGLALPYLLFLGKPYLFQVLKYSLAGFMMSFLFSVVYGMSTVEKEDIRQYFLNQP